MIDALKEGICLIFGISLCFLLFVFVIGYYLIVLAVSIISMIITLITFGKIRFNIKA